MEIGTLPSFDSEQKTLDQSCPELLRMFQYIVHIFSKQKAICKNIV